MRSVYQIVMVAAMLWNSPPVLSKEEHGPVEQVGVDVGVMVSQVVEHHLTGCHLVLITTRPQSFMTSRIISVEASLIVEAGWVLSQDQMAKDHLLQGLWGDARFSCRAVILDLTASNSTDLVLRLLEVAGLRERDATSSYTVFSTTPFALYMALMTSPSTCLRHGNSRLRKILPKKGGRSERVWVYRRCVYCNNGRADVLFIHQYNITSLPQPTDNFFQERIQNLMGHKLKIVSVPHFPFMDFSRDIESGSIIVPRDSIDARMLKTIVSKLNFTFEHRAEPELTWGLEKNGTFNGIIGQLQREETDFSTVAGPTPSRFKVVDYVRTYPADIMTVISLNPTLLPQHLSLIRPFEGDLWFALIASVVAWGLLMWLMQRAWGWVAGGRGVKFSTAILYSWGALLEQPPPNTAISDSGRLLVGWWLVFCLIITTGFRSSLIAHMTVQGKTLPIETFEDLVKQDNWKWGTEPWIFSGIPYDYFSKHTDPVIKTIYQKVERVTKTEGLQKVLDGGFTLIHWEIYFSIFIDSYYSDAHGNTPFHVSKKGVPMIAFFGWAFRKGAPFYPRFCELIFRLQDAGIISHWNKDALARRVRENKAATGQHTQKDPTQVESKEMSLGLHHLQGAFFLLFLGLGVAVLMLLVEYLAHSHSSAN
ncbi:glutamate receptor ionotropic, delta-2-like [Homarus americanus]|uniref:glutamate receptor ionotropic, delta-2-like n=1 Tax=Homarus americanus TaxID=6706 RepID=UPI001C47703A|nr:glutamate receptor ionotropic, delta-2-like [Homarus americanus]